MRLSVAEEITTVTPEGRRVALWRLDPPGRLPGPAVVVGPGFGRGMHQMAPVAHTLARHGLTVYRYDSLDHSGLSDGRMWDYTMSAGYDGLAAAVAAVQHATGSAVGVIANSLAARFAFRLAAQEPATVAYLVTVVGVVNLRSTLTHVIGRDLAALAEVDLPDDVEVERRVIGAKAFGRDSHEHDWLSLEGTIDELAVAPQPIVNFVAGDDQWVEPADVTAAFAQDQAGPRRLLRLPMAGHDFGRNTTMARVFLRHLTDVALGLTAPGTALPYRELDFDDLVAILADERRLHRDRRQAVVV